MTAEGVLQTQLIQKAWEDPTFRQKLIEDPKSAIKEVLGVIIPDHIKLRTVEESPDEFYLVIPPSPASMIVTTEKSKLMW
ncbi:NHLP leader peptide family RiPP precursor [Paenibacillus sp. JX-17]|uniref:NHLP leader peptide family RiPP n=1 Tax=Paenibacillus lacisoli TaxID=3064525 RepID=A0ABT9CD30_9BACL|nr:NHLP leader peptide family RiPP precursor [Paenibacillus sp. JX-17]MDO7907141.1 NHLP leader peptide family RiPP precursor [Paenibacillus sp. JX-17]